MIAENIHKIVSNIPKNVKLIAISKTKSNNDIMKAYESGQRLFGKIKFRKCQANLKICQKI